MRRPLMLLALAALGVAAAPPQCNSKFLYPNWTDCTKFLVCVWPGDKDHPFLYHADQCRNGAAFHPLHQNCSLPLDHPTCSGRPVPECTEAGLSGRLQLNPNIHWLCNSAEYNAWMFGCDAGQVLAPDLLQCVPEVVHAAARR